MFLLFLSARVERETSLTMGAVLAQRSPSVALEALAKAGIIVIQVQYVMTMEGVGMVLKDKAHVAEPFRSNNLSRSWEVQTLRTLAQSAM